MPATPRRKRPCYVPSWTEPCTTVQQRPCYDGKYTMLASGHTNTQRIKQGRNVQRQGKHVPVAPRGQMCPVSHHKLRLFFTARCCTQRSRRGIVCTRPPEFGTAYQTTSRRRLPSHHSVLRWRRICFPGLSDTGNMRHTDFVTWSWSAVCLRHVNHRRTIVRPSPQKMGGGWF